MKRDSLDPILKEIYTYFDFLFAKGYRIKEAKTLSMGSWKITLDSPDMSIDIFNDQGEINLLFSPTNNSDYRNQFGIRTIIDYLSHGKSHIGKFERHLFGNRKKRLQMLAGLLAEYLDQITPCFGDNFQKNKPGLFLAREERNDIFMERYMRKG
ncbi:MAG TPA: hypothetical protein VLZ89_03950 [Anaerolineales bacterium]|nr:hypothetical protein [Anaerolineales bacterium]